MAERNAILLRASEKARMRILLSVNLSRSNFGEMRHSIHQLWELLGFSGGLEWSAACLSCSF